MKALSLIILTWKCHDREHCASRDNQTMFMLSSGFKSSQTTIIEKNGRTILVSYFKSIFLIEFIHKKTAYECIGMKLKKSKASL